MFIANVISQLSQKWRQKLEFSAEQMSQQARDLVKCMLSSQARSEGTNDKPHKRLNNKVAAHKQTLKRSNCTYTEHFHSKSYLVISTRRKLRQFFCNKSL